jgi:ribonuclease G
VSLEILVNVAPRETRAAILENGVVQEVHIERTSRRGLVSNLYKGRVSRVLPGMQAAFVEIGLERTAFLHAADIAATASDDTLLGASAAGAPAVEDIRRLVNAGDEILVQVIKDPIGTKGARLTTFIALPSRYLVYMPRGQAIGVSARIEDEAERARLKTTLLQLVSNGGEGGYIIRTAAQGASADHLRDDMNYLAKLWEHVRGAAAAAGAGSVVHEDLPLSLRVLRDELARGVSRVLVDAPRELERMREFAGAFMPEAVPVIELYAGPRPLFDLNGVEEEIAKALDRKVPLKSGGHLVIDQTEAMTTIDVNTGAYVGHRNLEETIFRTNLEAAVSIARQLRLRNLGGIIIIDFIDMRDEPHRRAVLTALERALAGNGPVTDAYCQHFATGPGGDDPQAHPREPGTSVVRGVSKLRGARLHPHARDRLQRDFSGNCATEPTVCQPRAADTGPPGRRGSPPGRGVRHPGRARGAGGSSDPPAGRDALRGRSIRRRSRLGTDRA